MFKPTPTRLATPLWQQWLLIAAALLAATGVVYADLAASREPPEALIARNFTADTYSAQVVDLPASDFELHDRAGKLVRLSDLRGKVVFVNFWATWCSPCRQEIPDLEKLAAALEGVPFEIVAVSNDESWEDIDKFFAGRETSMHVLLDESKSLSSRYGTQKLPETYVIDRSGRIRLRFINAAPWTDDRIHRYLEWLATSG